MGGYGARLVYRTALEPTAVRVAIRDEQGRLLERLRPELHPRAQGGTPTAWVARFRVQIREALWVNPIANWEDVDGCGTQWLESLYRLRVAG